MTVLILDICYFVEMVEEDLFPKKYYTYLRVMGMYVCHAI